MRTIVVQDDTGTLLGRWIGPSEDGNEWSLQFRSATFSEIVLMYASQIQEDTALGIATRWPTFYLMDAPGNFKQFETPDFEIVDDDPDAALWNNKPYVLVPAVLSDVPTVKLL